MTTMDEKKKTQQTPGKELKSKTYWKSNNVSYETSSIKESECEFHRISVITNNWIVTYKNKTHINTLKPRTRSIIL